MTTPEPPTPVDPWIAELSPSIEADAARIVATARTVLKLDLSDPRVAKALELSALVALKRALAAELAEAGDRSPEEATPARTPGALVPEPLGRVLEGAFGAEPEGPDLPEDAIARIAAAAAEAAREAVLERFRREREAAEARAAVEAERDRRAREPEP